MRIDPSDHGAERIYRLMTGIVVPRSIAWAPASAARAMRGSAKSSRCRRCSKPRNPTTELEAKGKFVMTGNARRKSIHIGGFKHANPIPNACRIGNLVMSGVILGRDADGKMPASLEAQCANMFAHMKATVEAAGGTTDDIIKMTVWLRDRSQRAPVNAEWLKMFPDEHSRPARHALQSDMEGGALVQCDFTAVID
jgi:2-iminobutanoate/2-iminopropanoate deaminase